MPHFSTISYSNYGFPWKSIHLLIHITALGVLPNKKTTKKSLIEYFHYFPYHQSSNTVSCRVLCHIWPAQPHPRLSFYLRSKRNRECLTFQISPAVIMDFHGIHPFPSPYNSIQSPPNKKTTKNS